MDPALRELLEGAETDELEVILKLRHPQAEPPDVRLVARFGQVVTGRVERGWIREVWGHPEVESFKAPRLQQLEPEIIDLEAAGDVVWRDTDVRRPPGLGVTGRGTVIGLVDVGCDFAHPHFRRADGSTRLLALWDQSKTAPFPLAPYGYGALYSRDDINRALTHPEPYRTLGYHPAKADPSGIGAHGTLVMDIAAGNGGIPGSPQGMAPAADLIFVHAATGIREGLVNLGDSVRILEAVDFIARTARGRPWVINVSMGRRGGSHDGLSLVEQGMDALLLGTPGAALVLSTGNYFSSQAHASGQLRPAQQRTLIWRTDKADITPNELEIWYSGKDAMILEVRVPGGGPVFRAALAEDCPVLIGGRNVGHIYHRARDPNNGDNQINIFLRPEAPAGEWQITLIGQDIVDGIFHAWVERDAPCPGCDSRFEPQDADPYCTTGTLCNGFRTVAAGAYDGHSLTREMAAFSSCGPLRDFRQKPDLVAPGDKVLGARSTPRGEERPEPSLTRMSGTSFAAPHVTGTIALMFEAAGKPLSIQETRRLLLGSTRSLPESTDEAVRFGSGYLDIEAAVAAAGRIKEEGLDRGTETVRPAEDQSVAGIDLLPQAGIMMESNMTREDEDRREEEVSEWSPSAEEPIESGIKHLGLQKIYTESGIEGEEEFPETVVEVEEPKIEEPGEISPGGFEVAGAAERYPGVIEIEEFEAEEDEEIYQGELDVEEPEEVNGEEQVEMVAEEMDLGERLLAEADRIIASGGRPATPADFLSLVLSEVGVEVFGDPMDTVRFPAPEVIWKAWKRPASKQWDYIEQFVEVIAGPNDVLRRPLKTGDILVRVALGEPGLGHLALIADPRLWRREELAGAGLTPEGRRPGKYVQVVEGGFRPHSRWEGFARRLLEERGRVSGNQLVLRLRSGLASSEWDIEAAGVRACVTPLKGKDPSALRLYPAGKFEYNVPTTLTVTLPIIGQITIPTGNLRGIAYYPAEVAGSGKPFNKKLGKKGPAPIVFIAHGNHYILHDPANRSNEDCLGPASWKEILNYKGYEYFQEILACMGIIAVSIDCNATNCQGFSATNMWDRGWIIYDTMKHFISLNTGGDPIFGNHIDFSRTGLMGHSRGGEAVIIVPEIFKLPFMALSGVSFKGVISLAPTDAGASTGKPSGYAYMAILPAGDYDVSGNDGARFYDQAVPDPFKCQLYIHNACHNFFNTEWVNDEAGTRAGPAVMSKAEHKKILAVFGSAFYREVLLGHDTRKYLSKEVIFSGVKNKNIQISFELPGQITVDDHENHNILVNALSQPANPSGGLTADEFNFSQSAGAFNSSFFGNTVGMVATPPPAAATGQFRQQLAGPVDLTKSEIWLRTAEVYDGTSVPTGATGFKLGVEDTAGNVVWVDSDQVGGLPRPYDRQTDDLAKIGLDLTKTMLNTLRFPAKCFTGQKKKFDITKIQAILLQVDRKDDRSLAFDQLQIVTV